MQLDSASSVEAARAAESEVDRLKDCLEAPLEAVEAEATLLSTLSCVSLSTSSSSCSSTVTFSTDLATRFCRALRAAGGTSLIWGLVEDRL